MKFSVNQEQLLTGIMSVIRGIPKTDNMPVLQGVYIRAAQGQLCFTTTDLKFTIQCTVPARIETEGDTVVPGKLFSELVKKLPEMEIGVEVGENMTLNYFMSSVSLKTLPAEDFPAVSDWNGENMAIPAAVLKRMIKQTSFARMPEKEAEARPVFGGIYLEVAEGILNMVSTDTHRLAYRYSGVDSSVDTKVIIPGFAISEVLRLLRDDDEIVQLTVGQNFVGFKFGAIRLITRLIEGAFPPYKQVIPPAYSTKIRIATMTLTSALERAYLLSKGESNIVKFSVDETKKKLILSAQGENGKVSESVDLAEVDGIKVEVSFNARFMAEALRVTETEEIWVEFGGPTAAGVVRPYGDDNYIYLALPVRTAA